MTLRTRILGALGVFSLVAFSLTAAVPAYAVTSYYIIDNYGGNTNGYLTYTGPNLILDTQTQNGDAQWAEASCTGGTPNWCHLFPIAHDTVCANVNPSNNNVYGSGCYSGDPNEYWHEECGTSACQWKNRATQTWLTAASLDYGASVLVAGGGPTAENQWDVVTA